MLTALVVACSVAELRNAAEKVMFDRDRPLLLVVEDDIGDQEMTIRALQKEIPGARIAVARDGAEAIDSLTGALMVDGVRTDERPDLVLLDLKLPRFSGLDVLKRARADGAARSTPMVLFSSSDELSDVNACYAAGANSYVKKPVDYDEYIRVVRSVAGYWLTVAELPTPLEGGR